MNNSSKSPKNVGSEIYRSLVQNAQTKTGRYDDSSSQAYASEVPGHMDHTEGHEGHINSVSSEHGNNQQSTHKRDGISWKFIFFVILVLLPIRLFVAEPFLVYGSSMEPNFDTGDYLIVDELSYKISEPKRGDVIVLRPPYDTTKHFIKRVVGLPGETVEVKGNIVTIFNAEHPEGFVLDEPYITFKSDKESKIKLTMDQYFVMGDNRTVSFDSRSWGALPREDITGKAFLRLYPFKSISILPGDVSKFSQSKEQSK